MCVFVFFVAIQIIFYIYSFCQAITWWKYTAECHRFKGSRPHTTEQCLKKLSDTNSLNVMAHGILLFYTSPYFDLSSPHLKINKNLENLSNSKSTSRFTNTTGYMEIDCTKFEVNPRWSSRRPLDFTWNGPIVFKPHQNNISMGHTHVNGQ